MKEITDLAWRLNGVATSLPLDAKRKPTLGRGIESWYPYYAGFTEDFARGVLQEVASNRSICVLDPWNGSGTTTRIAHALGHRAIGIDLNPVANLVASAKVAHASDAMHIVGLARRISTISAARVVAHDPLNAWLAPSAVRQYRAIERTILSELATTASGERATALSGDLPPLGSFLMLALVRSARDVATVAQSTNPTWIRPGSGRRRFVRSLGSLWTTQVTAMAEDLQAAQADGGSKPWCGRITVANSRELPLENGTVDLVLTSPPYCTRIDYLVSTSFELAALGLSDESPRFQELRRAAMGTPLARKGRPLEIPQQWPQSVSSLLTAVRRHPSKASGSYYYKTFWQYFDDADASLREFARVMRPGAAALLVLQTSYYKDIPVDLPELYLDLARSIGLSGVLVGQAIVRRAIAQIHPHAARHRVSPQYREAVLALEKPT